MPRISIDNYDTIASWNGSQDLFIVEQPDGTKVATPAMVKQFIEAGNFTATGEIKDGHGNILKDMAKASDLEDAVAGLEEAIGEAVEDLSEVETISGTGSYGSSYVAYKQGRVVNLKITGVTNATTGMQMLLFYLPQGWRPLFDIMIVGSYNLGSFDAVGGNSVFYKVEAGNGKCWTYSYRAFNNGAVYFTYIAAE